MKIEAKPPGGSYFTLMDESAGGTLDKFAPRASQRNQNEALASTGLAGSSFKNFLGNTTTTLTLRGCQTYADRSAALAAARTVTLALQQLVHIKVSEPTGASPETQYYPNATIGDVEPDVQGASVVFSFQFSADLVTDTEPT